MKKNSILVGCRYQYTYAQAVVGKASVVSCQEGQGERRGCACMTKSRTMPSTTRDCLVVPLEKETRNSAIEKCLSSVVFPGLFNFKTQIGKCIIGSFI